MIVFWMLYALLISFWLGLAALLLERVLRALRRSARFVWISVVGLSALLPLGSATLSTISSSASSTGARGALVLPAAWRALLDRGLLLSWLAGSAVLVLSIVLAQRALLRARRQWQPAEVQGTRVLVSHNFGPGVIALGRAQIVLPAWALHMESSVQELLVQHEREHMRAGDHRLIMLGLLLLVLCPFNPIIWWQFSRLKLAIEMDCDARVLAGRRDVRRYAALLLDVGERSRAGRLVFAAFAAPPHAIERRIRMILDSGPKSRLMTVALAGAGALVIAVLACQTPEPASPEALLRSALGIVPEPPPPPKPPPQEDGVYDPVNEANEVYKVQLDIPRPLRVKVNISEGPPPPPPPPPPRPTGARSDEDHLIGKLRSTTGQSEVVEVVSVRGTLLGKVDVSGAVAVRPLSGRR